MRMIRSTSAAPRPTACRQACPGRARLRRLAGTVMQALQTAKARRARLYHPAPTPVRALHPLVKQPCRVLQCQMIQCQLMLAKDLQALLGVDL